MNDERAPHNLLLVEDSDADAELVNAYLAGSSKDKFEVFHVTRMSEALKRLHNTPIDIVLLDLRLPDAASTDSVVAIREETDQVPILVLTGTDDEELALSCIKAGAQDYLLKGQMQPIALRRAIGYALTRKNEADQREIAEARKAYGGLGSDASPTSMTAELAGLGPIKQRLPADFREFAQSYRELLRDYITASAGAQSKPKGAMEILVTRLGDCGAGPKDMIDLHVASLDEKQFDIDTKKAHTAIIEGRLMALEMMGQLVDYYRVGNRRHFDKKDAP